MKKNVTFMLFLKVKDEECPRTNTSDFSELDSPSTLIWEITQQIDRSCTVRVNSLSKKKGTQLYSLWSYYNGTLSFFTYSGVKVTFSSASISSINHR